MDLLNEYNLLCKEAGHAPKSWYQARGYKFEKLLLKVLKRDGLCPRASYKISGEQIDGSFVLGDKVYLLEAKWHKREMAASDIYAFKGKVDGKLVGTIGIFISISGFSKDSVDALIMGKEINIILFDKNDFEMSLEKEGAFKRILLEKIRMAAEEGSPFYPVKAVLEINKQSNSNAETDNADIDMKSKEVIIICEGENDEWVLKLLCQKMNKTNFEIIVANGMRNIPLLANKIMAYALKREVVLVTDSDGNETRVQNMFQEIIDKQEGWNAVIINDSIEDWFGIDKGKYKGKRRELLAALTEKVQSVDMEKMRKEFASFDLFYRLLNESVSSM